MNKYRSAMDKITVTPQMEERILRNVSSNKELNVEIRKQPYLKYIGPAGTIAACFVIVLGLIIFQSGGLQRQRPGAPGASGNSGGTIVQPGEQQVLIPNPIVNNKGIEELKKAVPFELFVPEKLPTGYKIDNTSVISGKLAQIIYSDGSNKITFRTAKGAEDISGDYTSYQESNVEKVGYSEVTLKGSNSLISLATWIKDDCSYSLSFSTGIEKGSAVSIIESMKKA